MRMIPIEHVKRPLKFKYQVTDTGLIFSPRKNDFLVTVQDQDGYEKVVLISSNDNKRHRYSVHRLVLENFDPVDGMERLQVNHIDGNKMNNNLSNLEWCTCSENIRHAHAIGLKSQVGERNNASKLSEKDVMDMISLYLSGKFNGVEISRMYGVSDDYFGGIKRGIRWKHLTEGVFW